MMKATVSPFLVFIVLIVPAIYIYYLTTSGNLHPFFQILLSLYAGYAIRAIVPQDRFIRSSIQSVNDG